MPKDKKAAPATKKTPKAEKTVDKSGKMGKSEIIRAVAEKTSMTQREVTEMFNAYIETVNEGLTNGRSVGIQELGSFTVVDIPERQGTVKGTEEPTVIPAGKKVQFRVSSILKSRLS